MDEYHWYYWEFLKNGFRTKQNSIKSMWWIFSMVGFFGFHLCDFNSEICCIDLVCEPWTSPAHVQNAYASLEHAPILPRCRKCFKLKSCEEATENMKTSQDTTKLPCDSLSAVPIHNHPLFHCFPAAVFTVLGVFLRSARSNVLCCETAVAQGKECPLQIAN